MNHLPPETGWLNRQEVRAVFAALEGARADGSRFVGGCVRNTLMGRSVDDIDIATQLKPDETIKALKAAGIRAIPTGIEHGTITAVVDHMPFEITSLRRDVETDGRRAVVAFTEDWDEDAERRDFRLNAIYADLDGKLYDPTGGGIDDAAAGRVIFIGEADARLAEDYLRILRFFRFNAWYGAAIDADGLASCARNKAGLERIAAERIWKELKKLLAAPAPWAAVNAMVESGVLGAVSVAPDDLGVLHDLEVCERLARLSPDPMQRLMALLPRRAGHIEALICDLRVSNAEAERLRAWADEGIPETIAPNAQHLRRNLYRFGKQVLMDRAVLSGEDVRDLVAACQAWRRPVFPLKGDDLLKVGMTAGPEMGNWLQIMEEWWIAGDFSADKAELLEELERRLKAD